MSAQPLTPPATDIEILESLDFDPNLPCTIPPPRHTGQPAALIVSADVHGCSTGQALLCRPCWDWLGTLAIPGKHLHCIYCGECLTRDQAYRIVSTIGGAS